MTDWDMRPATPSGRGVPGVCAPACAKRFRLPPGGDEFVVLLPDISGDAAISTPGGSSPRSHPDRIRARGKDRRQIGIAAATRDGNTADELLSAADRAMYEAKRRGKGGL